MATVFASFIAAPPAEARGRTTSQSKRLAETKKQLRAARSRLAQVRRTDAELMSTIRSVGHQLTSAKDLLYVAQRTLAGLELRIQSHERSLAKLDAQRTKRAASLDKRVATLYMMGPGAQADALLNAGSISDFVEKSSAFDFVVRADKINMEDLARLSDHTRKARQQLAGEASEAQDWRRQISERVSVVWDALTTHKAAEQTLSDRMKAYMAEVRSLEAEQSRIESLIYSRGSYSVGAISHKGFQWPVAGRRINSPYGPRGGGFHTGVDLDCNTGDATYAAKGGRVIAAEWGGGYGNMVIIDHGNGVSTLYAHHSHLYASQGQVVQRGQRIGACGSTGNSTGSHLHFEVRVNGHHTNPMPFIR